MIKALSPALVGLLLLVPARIWSQENAVRRHERMVEHLKKTAAEISSRSLLDIRTLEDWKERRPSAPSMPARKISIAPATLSTSPAIRPFSIRFRKLSKRTT